MITWADVVAIAPELSVVAAGTQTALLTVVGVMLPSPSVLGAKYDVACMYLAAHLGTLSLRGGDGPAGPLTSETVYQASRSFAAPEQSDYSATSYGLTFQMLVKNAAGARLPGVL